VELARRCFPPVGGGKFGYSEEYPPRTGGAGVVAEVEGFRWDSDGENEPSEKQDGPVLLSALAAKRFRILAVRDEEVVRDMPPLYVAHVQLLEERDTMRGPGKEALKYWQSRTHNVKAGTALVAKQTAPVFESLESWRASGEVPAGVLVIAAGPPTVVAGYLMVPIVPSGAVELTLFRDRTPGDALSLPSEEELKAVILNIGAGPWRGERGEVSTPRRKSRRRGNR